MKLNVEGSGHFDGIYELEEGYHNNRKREMHPIVTSGLTGYFRSNINPSIPDHIILRLEEVENSTSTQMKQMETGSLIRF